jgi:uncharacterized protein with ATP-grasp and redox domains
MQTTRDCLPCFLRQASYAATLCSADPAVRQRIVESVAILLPTLDFRLSPPENAVAVYGLIAELGGCPDPFADIKRQSNAFASRLRPQLEAALQSRGPGDPLQKAVKLAMAGNIIDYGAQQSFDLDSTVAGCLDREPWGAAVEEFLADVDRARCILYLADNCGELVFDGLLVQLLYSMGKDVTLAVKSKPILNDALLKDAAVCDLERYCRVIANGTGCPGTPLATCSNEFRKLFDAADLIISKGQGNFETLSETAGPIWYLLTVKCTVVAAHLGELTDGTSASPAPGEQVLFKNMTSRGKRAVR